MESSSLRVTGCIREAGGLGGVKYQNDKVVKSAALQYIRSAAALLLPAVSGHLHLYSTVSNTLMYTVIKFYFNYANTYIIYLQANFIRTFFVLFILDGCY